ncbi:NosL protein [Iodidimonas gelatinilytica]|uniref:NosL protein n=1 Tax=Iodidimonas gelatinilytica TaxID=1236966 RepID=A0A5A7MT54_9PROT|nr:nitrous oxide reductase accessory protein NosL [Iodidimonas gelatinilytica]GEQ98854.1 NosL protein [Iodidimonas gelatinilytica]GER01656.1 NosL protein [Iodidimonas gelatinilytica]
MSLSRAILMGWGVLAMLVLSGCNQNTENAQIPAPQEPDGDAMGYYCGMLVVNHSGPKGQIFLKGRDDPLWFSSVRDTITFTLLPEESKAIRAIYVNDMGVATNWNQPQPGAWVAAKDAVYVVGSDQSGGMGGPELVPFSDKAAAEQFQAAHDGTLYTFKDIPQSAVLGEPDMSPEKRKRGS